MAYIGNTVQNQGFAPAVDYFNGDGVTVTFTLSRPVASVAQLTAVIDNVIQNPSSAFTVSGSAITFTSAPLAGTNNIWVEYTSLVTTYAAISQDPSVIGDITASGGYLATGDFGNSYIDGTLIDYVTGVARITTGPVDDMTFYHGGSYGRSPMMDLYYAGGAKIYGTTALTIPVGTTAQRPTGVFGMIRANSTTGYIEYYDTATSSWIGIGAFIATGGTVTTVGSYTYHTFTSSNTFQVLAGTKTCDVLIVAGGGGGGADHNGAGGGAGGAVVESGSFSTGSYTVTIGAGGAGGVLSTADARGINGSNSTITGRTTAVGGGGGGGNTGGLDGKSGGSGGGGSITGVGASGTSGQGYAGGNGNPSNNAAGGGGGAGAVGENSPGTRGGNGGIGVNWQSLGTYYAGGGGGGTHYVAGGAGGTGGGGAAGDGSAATQPGTVGTAGTANTGGGGGAGSYSSNAGGVAGNAAAGGSGIVIIRYLT